AVGVGVGVVGLLIDAARVGQGPETFGHVLDGGHVVDGKQFAVLRCQRQLHVIVATEQVFHFQVRLQARVDAVEKNLVIGLHLEVTCTAGNQRSNKQAGQQGKPGVTN